MSERSRPPIVLTFAASDPSGGAGVQADLLTLAAMGCHPLSVLTAVTVQDTLGVQAFHAFDAQWVSDQARCVLRDMRVDAFKIGFVGSLDAIGAIAAVIARHAGIPVVLDPVLASGRGDEMASGGMIDAMCDLLLPLATVVTPNSPEARRLAARGARHPDESLPLAACAARLLERGARYVLVTGTHEDTPRVVNTLFDPGGQVRADAWDRLPGSYHGSGCTLASAIAAGLAHGLGVAQAVGEAQQFVWESLASGFRPGRGQYIPDRFARFRGKEGNRP
jgi:hydroxymethylpyrimidine/phosphomethylpyrimidine kinase